MAVSAGSVQVSIGLGTFRDYLKKVEADPKIADLSHVRVSRMIEEAGTFEADGISRHSFFDFDPEIYMQLHDPLSQIVGFFKSSKIPEMRKRILLLIGPEKGMQSSIAGQLKKGVEAYSRTERGLLYAIDGCLFNEEPLHLVPSGLRNEVQDKFGVVIEGDLCIRCETRVQGEFGGKIMDVPVKRVAFSENGERDEENPEIRRARGIAVFRPGQGTEVLVGTDHLQCDPNTYQFNGALFIASRGMAVFENMLSLGGKPAEAGDDYKKSLYNLLTLSEQAIKRGRLPMMYQDQVLIGYTNSQDYSDFFEDELNSALLDRIFLVNIPQTCPI